MKLEVHKEQLPETKRIYILPDGTTTNSKKEFEKANLDASLRRFAYQPELFDTPEISQARADLKARLEKCEQIPCHIVRISCPTQYIKPDGSVTHSETEFEGVIAKDNLRRFAFDGQQLFPDGKVEQARTDLKQRLVSGETIDIVYN